MTQAQARPGDSLGGKRVLVTGGSRGVGAAIARSAADQGASVAVNYRDKGRRAADVVNGIEATGARGLAVQADLTDDRAVTTMLEEVRHVFGGLDVLILNASGGLEKDAPAGYAMRLNRDAQVALVRQALPLMSSGGRVVFVTSHLAHFHGQEPVLPEYEVVARSKKAGEDALRALVPELASAGIDLVVVSGDLIEGTITPRLLERMRPGLIEERRAETGWLPTAEDFANAIVQAAASSDLGSGSTVYVGSVDGSRP